MLLPKRGSIHLKEGGHLMAAHRRILGTITSALALTVITTLGLSQPASAVEERPPDVTEYSTPQPEDTVEWQDIDSTGKPTGPKSGERVLADSGSGGSSAASGCKTVTVNNYKNSPLGDRVWNYRTWTSFCFTRSKDNIYSVTTGWAIRDVFGCYDWVGEVFKDTRYYDWASGYAPKSGYYHEREGHLKLVCATPIVGLHYYPRNVIRVHSNGTWTWSTSD
jgi:hypothetical protein